ncbi:MAG: DsrE family protein [Thermanaerothrix sp.]|uniref:DsrE family protein n=1 Tax=Thermanaerothrix sp. TaxID=2972675 RepID=UPI003C7A875E
MSERDTVWLFTRFGLGEGPAELQQQLAVKYLTLALEGGKLPAKVIFYTEGVRLACHGSPVLDQLRELEKRGVELVLCHTCLSYFGLLDQVQVGVVGSMADIIEALTQAQKVVAL